MQATTGRAQDVLRLRNDRLHPLTQGGSRSAYAPEVSCTSPESHSATKIFQKKPQDLNTMIPDSKRPARTSNLATSMKAAEALTGIPRQRLKLAKYAGCSAFRSNGKVNLPELLEYVMTDEFKAAALAAEHEAEAASEWDIRFKRAKALQAESRLKRERARAWDASSVQILHTASNDAILAVLSVALLKEQPALVEGKSAGQILAVNRPFYDQLVTRIREAAVNAAVNAGEGLPDDED